MHSANPFGETPDYTREGSSPVLNPFAASVIAQPDLDNEAAIIAQIASINNPFDDVLTAIPAPTSHPFPPDVEPWDSSIVAVHDVVPAPDGAEVDASPGKEVPVLPATTEDAQLAEASVDHPSLELEIETSANPSGVRRADPIHVHPEPEPEPEPELEAEDPLCIEVVEIAPATFAADVSRGCAALLRSGRHSDLEFVTGGPVHHGGGGSTSTSAGDNQRAHQDTQRAHQLVLELRCGAAVVQVRHVVVVPWRVRRREWRRP